MKKILSLVLALVLFITALTPAFFTQAETYKEKLKKEGFPDRYISSLVALHKKYPDWKFKAFKTGLSFSEAVSGERSTHRKQILETGYKDKYYCSCSNCKKNGHYVYQYSGCYSASQYAVEYLMDPRNWLDEKHIFQFESNKYSDAHTQSGVENIIRNTWMKNSAITFVNTEGNNETFKKDGKKMKYSKAIMEAAKAHNISAYYIASRIVKEVGSSKPSASGTVGTKKPFVGMYNYYSIGATSGGMSGLEWASGFLLASKSTVMYSKYSSKTGKRSGTKTSISSGQRMSYIGTYGKFYKVKLYTGTYSTNGAVGYINKKALRTTYFNYMRPWTNPYKTISGGAWYISDKYLQYQYTTYLEKFNVNKNSGALYNHEYMQNVDAPSHEAVSKYNAYSNAGQLSKEKTFYIPVYSKLPGDSNSSGGNPSSDDPSPSPSSTNRVSGLKVKDTTVTSISIKFKAVSGASKYYVKIKNVTKGSVFGKTVKSNSASLNNLTKGNVYKIWVKAYKSGKWGSYSKGVKARCKPSKSKITKITSPGRGLIKTTWQKRNADGYQLVYARDKKFKNVVAKKTVKSTSYTGKNFTKGRTYYVKVRAYIVFGGKKRYGKFSAAKSVKSK